MKKPISLDLSERIVAAYVGKEGTREEVAKRFKVSVGMVKKLLSQKEPDRGFKAEIPALLAQSATGTGAWQEHARAGGAGAGCDLGGDQAAAVIGLHDRCDPLGVVQAGADI